jgi:hypothetical protein
MTNDRQIDRLLDAWFTEGPIAVSDRVIDDVAARLTRQPQRPAWRLQPWRFPTVSTPLKAVLIGAAIVAALFAGSVLLVGGPRPAPAPVPTPTATPTAAPTPTSAPTATPVPTPRTQTGEVAGTTHRFSFTAPASWENHGWYYTKAQGPTGPSGIAVAASGAVNVPTDPCDGVGKYSDATTAEEVVAALRARKDLTVSAATDVTLGGLSGQHVSVELPADLSACSDLYIVFAEPDGSGIHAQGSSWLMDLWILEADTGPLWVNLGHFAGTPPADLAEGQAIVQSIQFTP